MEYFGIFIIKLNQNKKFWYFADVNGDDKDNDNESLILFNKIIQWFNPLIGGFENCF